MFFLWTIFIISSLIYVNAAILFASKKTRAIVIASYMTLYKAEKSFTFFVRETVQCTGYLFLASILLLGAFHKYIPYLIGYMIFSYISALVNNRTESVLVTILALLWAIYTFFQFV